MQYSFLTLGLLCLAEQSSLVSAKIHGRSLADASILGHQAYINAQVRKRADVVMNHADYARRDSYPELNLRAATLEPSNNQTDTACRTALNKLGGNPTNPSGMSICYNVATFDNSTGAFQAHLLLYKIAAPTGKWADLQNGTEQIGLQYPGATIQQGNVAKRDTDDFLDAVQLMSRATAPALMKDLVFVGMINSNLSKMLTNQTTMRAALEPNVTLSAKTTTGEQLNITLSNTDASFVSGFLTAAEVAAAAKPTPFVLPGTTLGIFPTGLIITSIWAVLFIGAVGFGTVGRIRFRSAYRRRTVGGQYGDSATGLAQKGFAKVAAYDQKKPA